MWNFLVLSIVLTAMSGKLENVKEPLQVYSFKCFLMFFFVVLIFL